MEKEKDARKKTAGSSAWYRAGHLPGEYTAETSGLGLSNKDRQYLLMDDSLHTTLLFIGCVLVIVC